MTRANVVVRARGRRRGRLRELGEHRRRVRRVERLPRGDRDRLPRVDSSDLARLLRWQLDGRVRAGSVLRRARVRRAAPVSSSATLPGRLVVARRGAERVGRGRIGTARTSGERSGRSCKQKGRHGSDGLRDRSATGKTIGETLRERIGTHGPPTGRRAAGCTKSFVQRDPPPESVG